MNWFEILRLAVELVGLVVVPLLAKKNAQAAKIISAFVTAIQEGDHQETKDALLIAAAPHGLEDHAAVKEAVK